MKKQFLILATIIAHVFAPIALAQVQQIPQNELKLGKKNTTAKKLTFEMNAGAANPAIKSDSATGKLQFSNDGTTFKDIGAGGGGGGGIELQENGDAESGTTGFTASGGTYSATSVAANVAEKTKSFSWDASAAAQTLTSTAYTVPASMQSQMCSASFLYKGGDANITVSVVDGAAAVLQSTVLIARTAYNSPDTPTTLGFLCPASGTVALKFTASADAAPIYFDQFKIGSLSTVNISQSTLYGTLGYPNTASCIWSTTSVTFVDTTAVAACPVATMTGSASANTSKALDVSFPNLPAGKYVIEFRGEALKQTASSGGYVQMLDGSTVVSGYYISANSANDWVVPVFMKSEFELSTTTTKIFKIQLRAESTGTFSITAGNTAISGPAMAAQFSLVRYPTAAEAAVRVGTEAWKVDANIAGDNPSLGVANVTSYTEATAAALTLTNNAGLGSVSAQIPCSGVNAPTGTTCAAGNESVGVSFNLPRAGDVKACVSFSHAINTGTAGGSAVLTAFQIVETPSNAQTILQEGKDRPQSGSTAASATATPFTFANRVCGTFSFSSAGQKTLRLMYEQNIVGTPTSSLIIGDGNTGVGQRDIHWTVEPTTQYGPQMVIPSGVISTATTERIERITFGGPTIDTASFCTVSPCTIWRQSGGFSSVTRSSTGSYALNFVAGTFSAPPTCYTSAVGAAIGYTTLNGLISTSTFAMSAIHQGTHASQDSVVHAVCVGPR